MGGLSGVAAGADVAVVVETLTIAASTVGLIGAGGPGSLVGATDVAPVGTVGELVVGPVGTCVGPCAVVEGGVSPAPPAFAVEGVGPGDGAVGREVAEISPELEVVGEDTCGLVLGTAVVTGTSRPTLGRPISRSVSESSWLRK